MNMDGFQRRKRHTQRKILEAALLLFMQYGTQKVDVSEIAKAANVSQVTIYNYFESINNLVHEVIAYYLEKTWAEYEELFEKPIPFPEKVEQMIFRKTREASNLSEKFFDEFMSEFSSGSNDIEKFQEEVIMPRFIELLDEVKQQGYIDPNISHEALLIYIQIFREYMMKPDVSYDELRQTEDLTKLFFYGLVGEQKERDG